MIVSTDSEVLQLIASSALAPRIEIDGSPRKFSFESSYCYRAVNGIGIEFTIDWREPFVFTLVWSPAEPSCLVEYINSNGVEVKMHLGKALHLLNVNGAAHQKTMLSLRGTKENIAPMLELSIQLLHKHLDSLNSNISKLFPSPILP
jgi:hypothetical protein